MPRGPVAVHSPKSSKLQSVLSHSTTNPSSHQPSRLLPYFLTLKMVKVEEIKDKDTTQAKSLYSNSEASESSSSLSSVSTTSSLGEEPQESFTERLSALVDIVPPKTRKSIADKVSATAGFFGKSGKVLGNIVWVVTTSALLIGLPLALSLEDEAKIVAQEREAEGQREGQAVSLSYLTSSLIEALISPLFNRCLPTQGSILQQHLALPLRAGLYHQASRPLDPDSLDRSIVIPPLRVGPSPFVVSMPPMIAIGTHNLWSSFAMHLHSRVIGAQVENYRYQHCSGASTRR